MSIPGISCCVDNILSKVGDCVIKGVIREVYYLISYKKHVSELQNNMEKLEDVLSWVHSQAERDKRNAKDIYGEVKQWLHDAEKLSKDVKKFLDENIQNRTPGVCFKVLCPNFSNHFKLGRQAAKKCLIVVALVTRGEAFMKNDCMSYRPPLEESESLSTIKKFEVFQSRAKILQDILTALRDDTHPRVGIYGMAGVGKTIMIEQVKVLVRNDFKDIALAVVSGTLDVKSTQGQLARGLGLIDLKNLEDESDRADLLRQRLKKGEKVLIILDDVWAELPLENIGIDFGDAKSCKILMASRKQDVCEENKCLSFKIDLLDEEEAWDLFKHHAGNCVDDQEIFPFAKKVCQECDRLPLIIRAVGKALKNGALFRWRIALEHFKKFTPFMIDKIDAQVYKTLEFSFSNLESEEEKSCLLLCSLFHENAEIPVVDLSRLAKAMGFLPGMDTLQKARDNVLTLVETLKTSGLLLEGRDENTVKLHDVIRDVAVIIAFNDMKYSFLVNPSEWPEMGDTSQTCQAISFRNEKILELPEKLECPQLHTLMLESYEDSLLKLPDTFFSGLGKLKVLSLKNISISPTLLSVPNPTCLRMLCLYNCKLADISILKEMSKLEMLIVVDSTISILPQELRELKHLRLLDLSRCPCKVICPGVLSNLSRLEELYLPECFKNWDAKITSNEISSKSILDELNSLTSLTSLKIHAPDPMIFPDSKLFKNLFRYDITIGHDSSNFDSYFSTKRIGISSENFVDRKGVVKYLVTGAESLFLRVSKGLHKVFNESNGEGFEQLNYLKVESCEGMAYLLNYRQISSLSFSRLTILEVYSCGFKYLFSVKVARHLEQLKILKLEYCEFMKAIIKSESTREDEEIRGLITFRKLEIMSFMYLPILTSFYSTIRETSGSQSQSTSAQVLFQGKVAFPALEELEICDLASISEIWENQCPTESSFSQLRVLSVMSCKKLEKVVPFPMLNTLQNLEYVSVWGCSSVVAIEVVCHTTVAEPFAEAVTPVLPRLRLLSLINLPKLEKIASNSMEHPHEIHVYPKLSSLTVYLCGSLKNVFSPSAARCQEHLENLEIRDYKEMEEIISATERGGEEIDIEIITFPQLKSLQLKGMPSLKSFWSCGEQEEEIVQDAEVGTSRRQPLFGVKVAFPSLEKLYLIRMMNISTVFSSSSLVRSPNLQELTVVCCDVVRELFCLEGLNAGAQYAGLGLLSRLTTLELIELPELQRLWYEDQVGILGLQQLRVLTVHLCPATEEDYNKQGTEKETGEDIQHARGQPQTFFGKMEVEFPNLEKLELRLMDNVTTVFSPNSLQRLANLQEVTVEYCDEVRELFDLEGLTVGERDAGIGLLSTLSTLELTFLPKLEYLWNKDPDKILGLFQSLTVLIIDDCKLLRNLFSCSVTRALQELRVLVVRKCLVMETIVYDEEATDGTSGSIVLPQLKLLKLESLPELRSFCSPNCDFSMPCLAVAGLYECPILHIFTRGLLRMPMIKISPGPNKSLWTRDLNKYLQGLAIDGSTHDGEVIPEYIEEEIRKYRIFEFTDW